MLARDVLHPRGLVVPTEALTSFTFFDQGRKAHDTRDAWARDLPGGLMTWLRDENPGARFEDDVKQGVIPLGVKNVDCVVNANALLAQGLAGTDRGQKGYKGALGIVVGAIEKKAWPACGLYYPQRMMFPYAASRAFRDGGAAANSPEALGAMNRLRRDVMSLGDPGSYDGEFDVTDDLAAALGVTTLLNLGPPADAEERATYETRVEAGIAYLTSRAQLGNSKSIWEPGIFFSGSFWALATWTSPAYTASAGLEALSKYLLGYDKAPYSSTAPSLTKGPFARRLCRRRLAET